MNRITSKQVVSMMEAVAQVYEQPENLLEFETDEDIEAQFRQDAERKKKQEAERLRKAKEREAADRAAGRASEVKTKDGVDVRYTRQSDGSTRRDGEVATLNGKPVRWRVDRTGKGSWRDTQGNVVSTSTTTPTTTTPTTTTPTTTTPTTTTPTTTTPTTPKPQLTDQQKVRAEYDRLRNSKDPKERAQAVTYGKQMAAAGASNRNFSGYQSAADAKKNLPAPAQRSSIADRLQAIRDMRAAAQSRIAAQGGTPATSAAKPKPKVAPPPVPSTTGTSTSPTTRQPLKNGDPMERMTGKGAQSLREAYSNVYEERTEEKVIDEGILDAIKKVGKAVLGPADQSPEAEAARMGARRPKTELQKKVAEKTAEVLKKEDVDLFDIIKGHLIEEGLTEEEALAKMLDLTDEERTEIIEGSCGSMKKKKKSKKGGY